MTLSNRHPPVALHPVVRAWHLRRARKLARKLEVQTKRCDMLQTSELEYRNSYYTDQLRDAVCERVEIASAKKYHEDRAATV